jgi:hypothetical protein
MPETTRETKVSCDAIQFVGKFRRREAEALALDIRELARRHQLTVAQFTVKRLETANGD